MTGVQTCALPIYVPAQRRDRDLGHGGGWREQRQRQTYGGTKVARDPVQSHLAVPEAEPCGVTTGPSKLTLGGLEISFSFSTVKLAFAL